MAVRWLVLMAFLALFSQMMMLGRVEASPLGASVSSVHPVTKAHSASLVGDVIHQGELQVKAPGAWESLVSKITNPTIAYVLLVIGLYGVFIELLHPGLIAPGVIGVLSLLVSMYGFHVLPINYTGLVLIVFGIILLVSEAFAPCYGSLGLGGTIAFVFGSLLLINSDHQSQQIAWMAIAAMAAANVLVLGGLIAMGIKARRKPVQHGTAVLIGAQGTALGEIHLDGQAIIRGEIWRVHSKQKIAAGEVVKVLSAQGLFLEVEKWVVTDKD